MTKIIATISTAVLMFPYVLMIPILHLSAGETEKNELKPHLITGYLAWAIALGVWIWMD